MHMPIEIGDVLEIPLPDGRRAYCQVVAHEDAFGFLIRVFDRIGSARLPLESLADADDLFPPVFSAAGDAVQEGAWCVAGRLPVVDFTCPPFVTSKYDEKTGRAAMWFLWEQGIYTYLGPDLPEEHKRREYLVVWSPADIVARIESGQIPYPYGELLRDGYFMPTKPEKPAKKSWLSWIKKTERQNL